MTFENLMRSGALFGLLPLLLPLTACLPEIPEGRIACAVDDDCPRALTCRSSRCYSSSSTLDADVVDTGTADIGVSDTGVLDTGLVDTGTLDMGALDTGTLDTGVVGPTFRGRASSGRTPMTPCVPSCRARRATWSWWGWWPTGSRMPAEGYGERTSTSAATAARGPSPGRVSTAAPGRITPRARGWTRPATCTSRIAHRMGREPHRASREARSHGGRTLEPDARLR
jgi:hypothetical protein